MDDADVLAEAVANGWVELAVDAGGAPLYRVTPAGRQRYEEIRGGRDD